MIIYSMNGFKKVIHLIEKILLLLSIVIAMQVEKPIKRF